VKRVVFVGADFAPSSLPPALRLRFFAGHLAAYGWRPTVLAVNPRFYTWPVDGEHERLVSPAVRVIRTAAFPARLARRLGVGDIGLRSLAHHYAALVRLCARREVDLLCIPVPPYMPMLLGRLIHAQFGVPYVVDYIDPWVTDYYWKFPPEQRPPKWPLANALARFCEPVALRCVGGISGVSAGTTDGVRARYPWVAAAPVAEIPYGGEMEDVRYVAATPRCNPIFQRDDGCLHLSYTGAMIPAMYPAVRAFFQAVRLGRERNPLLFERLRIHFVGTNYAPGAALQLPPLAREAGIEALIDEHPARISYLDALRILLDSHGLLVFGSEEAHYTASKIFPYIMARRPMLVLFHEASNLVQILRETQAATPITFSAERPPATQLSAILAELERMLACAEPPPTRWEAFEPYTTRAMAGRLAALFDQVVGDR
jgi:hypothetical protein